MLYPVVVHKDSNSDYGVSVPDLPGCFSAGSTLDEALEPEVSAHLMRVTETAHWLEWQDWADLTRGGTGCVGKWSFNRPR